MIVEAADEPPTGPDEDVLTVAEAAAFLRISREHLYDSIGRGEVPHRRIGRSIRLSRAALTKWLDTGTDTDENGARSCGAASRKRK